MVASWVKRFILYAPSPFISNRRAEPRRKLQTFSATQLLKKKKKKKCLRERQSQSSLMKRPVTLPVSMLVCDSLSALFPFLSSCVCAINSRCLEEGGVCVQGFGGGEDNVTLTLEKRDVHYCIAGQLQRTSRTNTQCIIQNILHFCSALPHANSIHYQSSRFIFNALTSLLSLIYTVYCVFSSQRLGVRLILF